MTTCEQILIETLSGIAAAIAFAIIVRLWGLYKRWVLGGLIDIMGEAIQHRNKGETLEEDGWKSEDSITDSWIRVAIDIESRAVKKAYQLSKPAGALVKWLDRIDPYPEDDEFARWWAILNKVIERIRLILKSNI